MHRPIFGRSFAVLVAPVLLSVLAFNFLNKKKTSARRNAEDVGIGTSTSMTASTRNCYEVFLSFRGTDTRKGFTDHLYNGLIDAGIDAFRDNEELRQGENIRPELLAAITNSKILIPILSVNYGTSSWCLDELVQMMECKDKNGQIVLPIFYNVKPADVGHQIGSFGDAFQKREKRLRKRRLDPTILEKWKKALLEVSILKGYEADGYEAKLVKSIVRKVLSELKKKFELNISENLVGIDGHVKEVMEFMNNKSHATLFVGIHGMGGIGKTTLAKAIYNKLSSQFEHRSFIADIRESWKRNGVLYLQNRLIKDILNRENEVSIEDEGIEFISSKFKGKKVLILLDDVDNVIQLKRLAGNHDWFSLGSRIIITTRNKGVLEEARVDHNYEHEVMDDDQSLILFSKHAFRKDSPLKDFEDLTREVISITKGLPLSLEVLGSLLCGKKLAFWRGTIDKLGKVPPKEVREKLKISIEALDYNQKQIFLDIACFFIGTSKNIVSYMWDTCDFFPKEGIEVLIFMSLIKVGDDHVLRMHDQLRDLGREIVREENRHEPQYRSRLWDYEEVQRVLKHNKGTGKIEGINLSEGNSEHLSLIASRHIRIYAEEFKNLTSLRFLHLDGRHLSGDFKDSMEELSWLRWPYCPANFEVDNFGVKELAVLELEDGLINEKWEGWNFFMMAEKLKYLDLSSCQSLKNTDFLSAFKKLEVLILRGCHGLKRIDASIEDMEGYQMGEKLKYLDLSNCASLENTDFLSAFKKLEVLILHDCCRLKRIDASIEDMEGLLRLELVDCLHLKELPAKIGKLKALQQLNLFRTSLSALPNSIGSLENLEILDISESDIEELPNGIGSLRKLRELRAYSCRDLKRIMVESMCNLSSLRRLDFAYCRKLRSLPDLPSGLTYLGVTCRSCKLPSLSHLAHLKELILEHCKYIQCIQELPSTQLKSSECSQPTDIEEMESPQSLNTPFKFESLEVNRCGSIETLNISQFVHLRTLQVSWCKNLLEVRVLDKSIYLESLTISYCNSIKQLDFPKLEGLKILSFYECHELAEIQGLDRLEYLERLFINRCVSLERLDLKKSRRLKELNTGDCENLAEIQGLDSLEYLESLDIFRCTSIGRLDLLKSGGLKKLEAEYCENLAEIQGLDSLEYLESLDISSCTSVGRLDLSKSKRLKILKARDCENLVEIQGLDRLKFLEELNIIGCKSLKTIPELSGTRIYRYYEIAYREMMEYWN